MPQLQSIRFLRFVPTVLLIFFAATGVGLVASAFAGLGYGLEYKYHSEWEIDSVLSILACVLGTSASGVAGIVWSVIMIRRTRIGRPQGLMGAGVLWGVVLGVCATLVMHVGLIITIACNAPGRLDMAAVFFTGIGLLCGVVAGLLLGAIGGWSCTRIVRRETARSDQL